MTQELVTRKDIETAIGEYLRQFRQWERRRRQAEDADGVNEEEDEEEEEEEEEEESPNIQVVIARGVTHRMKRRIPAAWLAGLAVELLPGGVLVLVAIETIEHCITVTSIGASLLGYGDLNGLAAVSNYQDPFSYSGHQNRPDALLLQDVDAQHTQAPILVVEVSRCITARSRSSSKSPPSTCSGSLFRSSWGSRSFPPPSELALAGFLASANLHLPWSSSVCLVKL